MAYNTLESIDNTLRGEPYGQMTPEGQSLWDQYQSLLGAQQNAPTRPLKLRSGATMNIIDPSFGLKNRMLSKTLSGMNQTGLGTRAKAQPGLFAQLAPFLISMGIKNPEDIKKAIDTIGGWGSGSADIPGTMTGNLTDNFTPDEIATTGGDWGWLD